MAPTPVRTQRKLGPLLKEVAKLLKCRSLTSSPGSIKAGYILDVEAVSVLSNYHCDSREQWTRRISV